MAFERHRDKNGRMSRKHGNTLRSISLMGARTVTSSVMYSRSWTSHH